MRLGLLLMITFSVIGCGGPKTGPTAPPFEEPPKADPNPQNNPNPGGGEKKVGVG